VPAEFALWSLLSVALLISVVTDLSSRKILDVVTYPAVAIALIVRFVYQGRGDVEHGLVSGAIGGAGAALVFALMNLLWKKRGFGWGDVKLVAAVGAAFGYPAVVAALVFISLVGALQVIVTLIWQGAVWETIGGVFRRLAVKAKLADPKKGEEPQQRHVPYGVAIALGSFWAMWWEHSQPRSFVS
jgi:prepilin peptidase CpaA